MKFATRSVLFILALMTGAGPAAASFEDIIREAAKRNGFAPPEQTRTTIDPALFAPGEMLFKSEALSLNGNISCQTCHLDKFGSADGLPNAVAVGGKGEGRERAMSDGGILPRNTLPFWGRGGVGFSVFFWDGKVDFSGTVKRSQFGSALPSDDPFVTAVHLPIVEIREMLDEDSTVSSNKRETVKSAENIFAAILVQLRAREPAAMRAIAAKYSTNAEKVTFPQVATALATFIRERFRIRETKFHRFVFGDGALSAEEMRGAQLFYGKAKCANCHSGPYFTDFQFHAVPLPQIGFGKNGFGVDYGRFNITHDPGDLYKFRTPPLYNVEKTAPYGHSGSVASLKEAIVYHFDPLRGLEPARMDVLSRHELYKRLAASAASGALIAHLADDEVAALVAFLRTLSFEPADD